MKKEFNLSEKRYQRKIKRFGDGKWINIDYVPTEDIKEFIRLLKEEMKDKQKYFKQPNWAIKELIEFLDKLAGNSLIELKGGK